MVAELSVCCSYQPSAQTGQINASAMRADVIVSAIVLVPMRSLLHCFNSGRCTRLTGSPAIPRSGEGEHNETFLHRRFHWTDGQADLLPPREFNHLLTER